MKPDDSRHPWRRLVNAARTVREEQGSIAPHGFATRVVARAWSRERHFGSLFERFAFRAVGVAGLLAALSIAVNVPALTRGPGADWRDEPVMLPADDTFVMLDFVE